MNAPQLRLTAALTAALFPALGAHGQSYTISEMQSLAAAENVALGMSASGVLAGFSITADRDCHAVIWGDYLIDLGVLPGYTQSAALAVSPSGQAIGVAYAIGGRAPRGFAADGALLRDLGDFAPRAINAAGDMAGVITVPWTGTLRVEHAAALHAGAITDLGTIGGSASLAMGINSAGWIVGVAWTANDTARRPCLWLPVQTGWGPAIDLGTLGGSGGQAYAISDTGRVVGVAETADGGQHAFLFALDSGGSVTSRTDLGSLAGAASSFAYALNNAGIAVGTSDGRAFVASGASAIDLNTRLIHADAWRLESATAIDSAGRIAGWGTFYGQPRAFTLTPCLADLSGDGTVTVQDFLAFLAAYAAAGPAADLNADGQVNISDFLTYLQLYTVGCP